MKQETTFREAHRLAVERLEALDRCLLEDNHECSQRCAMASAPYCGCHTCIVREVIDASYDHLHGHFIAKHAEKLIIGAMLCFALGVLTLTLITEWATR